MTQSNTEGVFNAKNKRLQSIYRKKKSAYNTLLSDWMIFFCKEMSRKFFYNMKVFFTILFVGTVMHTNAQLEDLTAELEASRNDTDRIDMSLKLAKAYLNRDPIKSLDYAESSILLSRSLGLTGRQIEAVKTKGTAFFYLSRYDSTALYWHDALNLIPTSEKLTKADLLNNLALLNQRQGKYDTSLIYHRQAYDIRKDFPDTVLFVHSIGNMAGLYRTKGDYGQALKYYFEALGHYESFNMPKQQSDVLNGIGLVYLDLKKPHESLDYLKAALEIRKELGDMRLIASSTNNIASCLKVQENFSKAETYYLEYLKLVKELHDRRGVAGAYSNLGNVAKNLGKYRLSMEYYQDGLELFLDMNEPEGISMTATNLGSLSLFLKQYREAIEYYKMALENAEASGSLSLQKSSQKGLSDAYRDLGQYRQALEHLERYAAIKDELFNQDLSREIAEYQQQYEAEKRAKEIEILKNQAITMEKESAIKDKAAIKRKKELELSNAYRNGAIFLSILAVILLLLLYNRFTLKKRLLLQESKLLENQKEEYRLKSEIKQNEIEVKNRELSSMASNALHKNELLTRLKESVDTIKQNVEGRELVELEQLIRSGINLDKDWDIFQRHFTSVHPDFFNSLKQNYPTLTSNDLRICAYLRMNLSTKEIASLMNIEAKSVRMNRYRLKKKLDLAEDQEVQDFMLKV